MLPFDGGPPEQAVRRHQVQVVDPSLAQSTTDAPRTWRVLAPVTEREEVIGLLARPGLRALPPGSSTGRV